MPVFDYRFQVQASLDQVRRFHGSPSVLPLLTPPPLAVKVIEFGEMQEGMTARFTVNLGPFTQHWEARHEEVSPQGFTDVQVSGPLRSWRHRHRFRALPDGLTEIQEHIEYRYPDGIGGWAARLAFSRPALWLLFRYREWITKRRLSR